MLKLIYLKIFFILFYALLERAMVVRQLCWDSLKIGKQLLLLTSVVICLLSTGAPARKSLDEIWSTPVAFLMFILLTSLSTVNYRPVSILPTISKVYEMVLSDQLTDLFENIFHTFSCAFRKGHGCQTTLLRLLEDWKTALDKNQYEYRTLRYPFLYISPTAEISLKFDLLFTTS
jgi:hypothetical protein